MDCRDIQDDLGAYLDSELPAGDARRTRDHLESCPTCRELSDQLAGARAAFRELTPDAAAGSLHAALAAAAAEAAPARVSSPRVGRIAWLSAGAVAAMLTWLLLSPDAPPPAAVDVARLSGPGAGPEVYGPLTVPTDHGDDVPFGMDCGIGPRGIGADVRMGGMGMEWN